MTIQGMIKYDIVTNLGWFTHEDNYIYTKWQDNTPSEYSYFEVRAHPIETDGDLLQFQVLINLSVKYSKISSLENGMILVIDYICDQVIEQNEHEAREIRIKKNKELALRDMLTDIDRVSLKLEKEYKYDAIY